MTPRQNSSVDESNDGQTAVVTSDQHAAVLKRLEEVATTSYPFPIPERRSTKDLPKEERLNLTSTNNLRPLFVGMIRFVITLCLPPLTVLFLVMGYFVNATKEKDNTSTIPLVLYGLAVVCMGQIVLFDPFFMHWISNGMFGGLGKGAGAKPPTKDGLTCKDNARNNYIR